MPLSASAISYQPSVKPVLGAMGSAKLGFGMIDQPLLPSRPTQLVSNSQTRPLLAEPSADSFSLSQTKTTPEGLQITDTKIGAGAIAKPGQTLKMHYTGTLYPSGKKFDSSLDRGEPFEFTLGAGEVIQGWDQGIEGMRVGGERELIIPPALGYGKRGAGEDIPPNATLKFVVQLLDVN